MIDFVLDVFDGK